MASILSKVSKHIGLRGSSTNSCIEVEKLLPLIEQTPDIEDHEEIQ